jgi:hypothetical protein
MKLEKFINGFFRTNTMKKNTRPIKRLSPLITEICGGNNALISSVHHGLAEVDMSSLFPHLDLDELIMFAAASWQIRQFENRDGKMFLSHSLEEIFDHYINSTLDVDQYFPRSNPIRRFANAYDWLSERQTISEERKPFHQRVNPFQGKDLQERLSSVEPAIVRKLRDQLLESTKRYVFECDYTLAKDDARSERNPPEIVVMTFQTVYPRKGGVVPRYATEIGSIIKRFPTQYIDTTKVEPQTVRVEPPTTRKGQYALEF